MPDKVEQELKPQKYEVTMKVWCEYPPGDRKHVSLRNMRSTIEEGLRYWDVEAADIKIKRLRLEEGKGK